MHRSRPLPTPQPTFRAYAEVTTSERGENTWKALLGTATPLLKGFFARRIGRGQADLDDLVQETLIAAYLRRMHYDAGRPFRAWLFGIARHKLADHFRTLRLRAGLERVDDDLAIVDFEPAIAARLDVERLLRALPAKQANAIRDVRIEGLSSAEASSLRAISPADVRVSVHRGVKTMQRAVGAG